MQVPTRLVLVSLCLAAFVAGGCGGGDRAATSADPAKLLGDTFGAAKPVRSGRVDLRLDVRARGLANLSGPLAVHVGRREGGLSLSALGIDPRRWLRRARQEGEADVGGTRTIHIAAGVDVARLLGDVDRLLAKAGSAGVTGATGNQVPVSELAAAMRRVLGGNQRYEQCLRDSQADLAKAQACADLVGQ